MKYTIYQITNKINSKIYIGKHQTKDLNDEYMGSGKIICRAQQKYGIENFTKEILYVFDTELEMNLKEAEIVTEDFCLRKDTYNLCVGGQGGFSYINRMRLNLYGNNGYTDNVKDNFERGRATQKYLRDNDPEWKQNVSIKMSQALKGREGSFKDKKHSAESKQKIGASNSIAQSGSKNSQFGSFWITDSVQNKKVKSLDIIPVGWYKGRVIKKNEPFTVEIN